MKVVIAVPTTGQVVSAALPATIVHATLACKAAGAAVAYRTIDSANIVVARDYLAHVFLADTTATHLLFLDHDMAVSRTVFARFLRCDAPFVGAVYTTREIDLEAYAQARAEGAAPAAAKAKASRFNAAVPAGALTVRDGFAVVTALGLGVALIRRGVFERLSAKGKTTSVPARGLGKFGASQTLASYFAPLPGGDGAPMSEDYSFCQRVREVGFDILGYVEDGVGHVGAFTYGASFAARFSKT